MNISVQVRTGDLGEQLEPKNNNDVALFTKATSSMQTPVAAI
jgi:hypothetical protein